MYVLFNICNSSTEARECAGNEEGTAAVVIDRVTVIFADGSEVEADVMGSDPDSDLAVLKIDSPPDGLLALATGDSQELTMTLGIISAMGRSISSGNRTYLNPQVMQTDAPINPGNSGGPLLDRHGSVIGVTSQIISSGGNNAGVGFAIPVNTAKRIVPELIATGKYDYAYIGIRGMSLTPMLAEANGLPRDARGALVAEVVHGGPAEFAGLLGSTTFGRLEGVEYSVGGDVILRFHGAPVGGIDGLTAYMTENNQPGDRVTLDVLRAA